MAERVTEGVIRPPKAPNLPLGPQTYEQRYQDQFLNILRLYFNTIDNFSQQFVSETGGSNLRFPYIAASDSTDQYATADNTPTLVRWDSADSINGWTLNPTGSATPDTPGVYNIVYSLQFANTSNTQHDVDVWLRVDGVDVPKSASKFTLPARKSAGVSSYIVAYSSVAFEVGLGAEVSLYWATDKAYSPTGPVDGIYMEFAPAQTVPYSHPSIPSAIGSITFVSGLY